MKISAEILNVIDAATITDNELRLSGQLDRKTYVAVAAVIEAAGGKWNKKAKAHVFGEPAADAIDQLLATGEVTTRQELQQFFTPSTLAAMVVALADVRDGHHVYEPSAGAGALIRACDNATRGVRISANEPDEKLHKGLVTAFYHHFGAGGLGRRDFLSIAPNSAFDRIVMNPPFAKQADIRHVSHAIDFLKPGGRLVAIMSSGTRFRENALARNFRGTVSAMGGTFADLPEGSFKQSGTMVNACLVALNA